MYLNTLDLTKYTTLGSAEYPAYTLYDSITQVIRQRLSPEAAALLAEPVFDDHSQQIDYQVAAGGALNGFNTLADEAQNTTLDKLTRYAAEIRVLADRYLSGNDVHAQRLGQNLLQALHVPDVGHIFVVNGEPVLTGWGLKYRADRAPFDVSGAQSLKSKPTPAVSAPTPTPVPSSAMPQPAVSAAKTKVPNPVPHPAARPTATVRESFAWRHWLLALLGGLLLLYVLWWLLSGLVQPQAEAPAPVIDAIDGGDALVIPSRSMETGDLGFLQGEWVSITDLVSSLSNEPVVILYAFDQAGGGTTTITRDPSGECVAPVKAQFKPDQKLYIEDQTDVICTDGVVFRKSSVVCEVADSGQATCLGRQVNHQYNVTLKRTAARGTP